MQSDTRNTRIEVLDCRFVDPLALTVADIRIEDISHALSMQCRFNGYTKRHYSVAEHSINVAYAVSKWLSTQTDFDYNDAEQRTIIRQALLHDATEAYMLDMPKPVKNAMPIYCQIEAAAWDVIAERFAVPVELHKQIKIADSRMCVTEKVTLLSAKGLDLPEWKYIAESFPAYGKEDGLRFVFEITRDPAEVRDNFLDLYSKVSVDVDVTASAMSRFARMAR